ncbi:ABC transporter permease [Lederbergia sp. NSJ-179]|uniref:ABC transporter permease n=1 Tax=Lederbergia sp. NSJ-179 TaxID=2931402 RepID=UPI001FD2222C|nr:ABC transporter permease [Lederbergia sp. NSJ-179]MCJ7841299.1 ABC transporter permease [Lederbergia sp. NSJ-179]
MLNNRWLTGSLFLGLVITVSLVASIPIYTSGVMQKLLVKELEDHQVKTGEFPGTFTFMDSFASSTVKKPAESFLQAEKMKKEVTEQVGLPILAESTMLNTIALKTMYEEEARQEEEKEPRDAKLVMITGIEDQITLVDGTFPQAEPVDGVVEVLVTEEALMKRNMVLGTKFIVHTKDHELEYVVKPVGAFQPKAEDSPFWSLIPANLSQDFIVPEAWFRNEILQNQEDSLWFGRFMTAFDYYQITDLDFPALIGLPGKIKGKMSQFMKTDVSFDFPIHSILKTYEQKGKQMTTMLWSLNVPVLMMLAIYLYMISQLIIERQLNEISVFFSRGASRLQIVSIYFIEAAILGILALALGPIIGLQICKILGASNGFLEFVQRKTLPVELSQESYLYALLTVIVSLMMVMIPVFRASGKSIVSHKQKKARNIGKIHWYLVIFEIALLAASIYQLITFNKRQKELLSFNIESADLMIDPILFFLPAVFIIGCGLVALRVYPWVIKAVFKIGERFWPLSLYSTFLQVSRASKQYKFLMMFLVMTIGMGVFSASAARTINTNLEDQLLYQHGAEIRMKVKWQDNLPPPAPIGYNSPEAEESEEKAKAAAETEEVIYTEPPFEPIANLEGVAATAKVFQKNELTVTVGDKSIDYGQLMAIETKDFGETVWFKDSLLPYHWYHYLNLIAKEPSAVIISKQTAEALKVKKGDSITLSWSGSDSGEFIVYEIVEYWPTFNPLEKINEEDDQDQVGALVVANLPYVQTMLGLEPYEVWMKVKPEASRAQIYEDIKEAKIPVVALSDVLPQVTELKNSALLLGVNGTMTMGFLISLLISFIGFLLYWILTMKARTLQYGIYRAMGVSMPKLIGILVSEQIFTSGIACVLGVVIGGIASMLYVPLFKLSLSIDQLMPPFAVISDAGDEAKIYLFATLMLLVGAAILIGFLRKIKIDQAVKLGED